MSRKNSTGADPKHIVPGSSIELKNPYGANDSIVSGSIGTSRTDISSFGSTGGECGYSSCGKIISQQAPLAIIAVSLYDGI